MSAPRRVLVTGAHGQLGWELARTVPGHVELHALDRHALDLGEREQVFDVLRQLQPETVINAAAYTAVDRAESEPELAQRINADGAGWLAEACAVTGARLVHVSTDYVFDGVQRTPYRPDDATNPINTYGRTKLIGERRVHDASGGRALIVRTAWVYSAHGHNFVKTMLRLMAERDSLNVVADQTGSPTWARNLADTLWACTAHADLAGTHHWSDGGECTWHGFALAIQQEALALGLLKRAIPIAPIETSAYPTPARRSPYSVLDKTALAAALGHEPQPWRDALRAMLAELAR